MIKNILVTVVIGALIGAGAYGLVRLVQSLPSQPPYTPAQVVDAIDECQLSGLDVYWIRHDFNGVIIGHQCAPANFRGIRR